MNDYDACKALLKIMDEAYGAPVVTTFPDDHNEVDAQHLDENFPMGVQAPDTDEERVSYSKTKTQGDARVVVSADANSMEELHSVLKLAGIDFENKEPEAEEPADPYDKDSDDVCDCCGKEIVDGDCGCDDHEHPQEPERDEYTTDKQKIIDVIKSRLANKLS